MADSVSESLSGEEWAEAICWRMVSKPSGLEVIGEWPPQGRFDEDEADRLGTRRRVEYHQI